MARSDPRLSVVVTSYSTERLKDIYDVLDSLKAQTLRGMETLFVAEKSQDLCQQVEAYAESSAMLVRTIFHEGPLGMSGARNLGIREATGSIIAFIDDDALAFPEWASCIVKTFADESIIAVTGPAMPLWVDGETAWLPKELYWIIGCTDWVQLDSLEDARNVWGMNMAFRREAFELAGAFSTDIGGVHSQRLHGEEVELSLRVRSKTGKRIVYNPEVRVMHKVYSGRLSLRWIAKTSYWIGYTRRVLQEVSQQYALREDFLTTERGLLARITLRLLPRALVGLVVRPWSSLRVLWVAGVALSFASLGYFRRLLMSLQNRAKRRNNRKEAMDESENG